MADAAIGELDARVVNEGANLVVIKAKSHGDFLFRERVVGITVKGSPSRRARPISMRPSS